MEIKEQSAFGRIVGGFFTFLALLGDAILLFSGPQNVWVFILGLYFASIPLNIFNVFLAKSVYEKYNLHPMLLLLFFLIGEAAVILASMAIIMASNNGVLIACADACNKADFVSQFGISFGLAQLFFVFGYIYLIIKSFKHTKEKKI